MSTDENIGLIAGWGRFPICVAEKLRQLGHNVYCVGVHGHADPALKQICTDFREFGMGKMGAQVRYFQRHGITRATMAGKIFKTLLFQKFHLIKHLPDLTTWRHFYPMFLTRSKDRRDDTLLTTVTELYAANGIRFAPATDFAPELLVKEGVLTDRKISEVQLKDIRFGWQIAKQLGRLDIGQSVAVNRLAVLAVEAIEGTDECIRRAGSLCGQGGFTVVKVAKPQQDMRFDVPTVGVGTIQTMVDSGGRILAIEAGKTIMLDEKELITFADRHRISIVALDAASMSLAVAAA